VVRGKVQPKHSRSAGFGCRLALKNRPAKQHFRGQSSIFWWRCSVIDGLELGCNGAAPYTWCGSTGDARHVGAGSLTIALLLLPTALHAQAEKRIALLIGNKDYKAGVGALTNPLNDIRIVGEALKAVGFEVLKPVENAQRSAMLIAIHAFAAKLKTAGPGAVGFLYYSGHGIASAGENYLIPADVDEPSTVLLSVQGVKQSEVLGILRGEAPNAAHYLVLDACRHTLRGARGGKGSCPWGSKAACWWPSRPSRERLPLTLGKEAVPTHRHWPPSW
jgi:Caspase domain